jgi:hypothetical protein
MKIRLTRGAERDLARGADFYNNIRDDLGVYFNDCLASDIDSLVLYAGIHAQVDGWYYTFSTRFPFVIWYGIDGEFVNIFAVLDCRAEPSGNEGILRSRRSEYGG